MSPRPIDGDSGKPGRKPRMCKSEGCTNRATTVGGLCYAHWYFKQHGIKTVTG